MMHNRRACEMVGCPTCWDMARAHLNLVTNPRARLTGSSRLDSDPVLWHDAQTSYHDLRVALCLAGGVSVDDIHPVTGHYVQNQPRKATT